MPIPSIDLLDGRIVRLVRGAWGGKNGWRRPSWRRRVHRRPTWPRALSVIAVGPRVAVPEGYTAPTRAPRFAPS